MANLTNSLESGIRKKIDLILLNLGWNTDEDSKDCNVFTERAKTIEQNKKFKGKNPDYVLYRSGTDEPIAIIETKRKGQSLDTALQKSIEVYAKPLNIPLIFATDGSLFKSHHLKDEKELTIDGQTITELFSEKKLLRFVAEGYEISELTKEAKHTREELINTFKWTNDLLRKEGLREGIERFTEFANIIFLKLISELEEDRGKNGEERLLADKYCWKSFADLDATRMMEYINGTILPHLVREYNHSGDVFQQKLSIKNPETLKKIVDKLSDLKLINTDSDVKGDAFEYFLKNSVTIGNDLGEYFTPRHIVKLMVGLLNPQFGDKVYDPTCGTGGFLIEAFRHIKRLCKPTKPNLKQLKEGTTWGREITNTAQIAKMNMILIGDGHTNINQMDSLEHPIKNEFDIVLANIPYGQTTDWGNLYPVPSKQADCIFIQHILLSLTKKGKAAIIVPEGFLFRSGDKKAREYLVKNYKLHAVISLPAGIFLPYTSAKTNITVIEAGLRTEKVWFYDLQADGFELSLTRKPIPQNDIGDLISKWDIKEESEKCWNVDIKEIEQNDYNLSITKYKERTKYSSEYPIVSFSDLMKERKESITIKDNEDYKRITIKLHGQGVFFRDVLKGKSIKTKQQKVTEADQFIVAEIDAKVGGFGVIPKDLGGSIVSSHYFLFDLDKNKVLPRYFDYMIRIAPYESMIQPYVKGTTNYASIRPQDVLKLKMPLPSIDIQQDMVEKLDRQREVLESANKTISLLSENIVTEADFYSLKGQIKTLNEVCRIQSGGTPSRNNKKYFSGNILWVKISDMKDIGFIEDTEEKITQEAIKDSSAKLLPKNAVLVSIFATIGAVSILSKEATTNQAIAGLIPDSQIVDYRYLAYSMRAIKPKLEKLSRGIAQNNINMSILKNQEILIPSFKDQLSLIDRIDQRKRILEGLNKVKLDAEESMKNIVHNVMKAIK